MVKRVENVIYVLPIFLVLVTAFLDLGLAAGLALAFVIGVIAYQMTHRRGWEELTASMTNPRQPRTER